MKKEDGSILVLTILAVLILSILVTGLLNVGTTELYTTQNYHLSKVSHYTAVQGVEEIRDVLANNPDTEEFEEDSPRGGGLLGTNQGGGPTGTQTTEDGLTRYYITGTLENMEAGSTQKPQKFTGFPPPPIPGLPVGTEADIVPQVWLINITSKVKTGKRVSYTEIQVGIMSIIVID